MSALLISQGSSPIANALTDYAGLAYTHPTCKTTWFVARLTSHTTVEINGTWYHRGIVSVIKGKKIPDKADSEVHAVDHEEYTRLMDTEVIWWERYNAKLAENGQTFKTACQYAHKMADDDLEKEMERVGEVVADGLVIPADAIYPSFFEDPEATYPDPTPSNSSKSS